MLEPRFVLDLVQWLVTLGLAFTVWLRKPGTDAAQAVRDLADMTEDRLSAHASRLASIETHMKHMPTTDELIKLEGLVGQINERSQNAAEAIRNVRVQLNRIEDFLLRSKQP